MEASVYEDIRKKLIAKGIPPQEIAFIHDANTDYSDFRLIPINLFWGLYFSPFRYIYRNKFFSSL